MKKTLSIVVTFIMALSICFGSLSNVYALPEPTIGPALSECTWEEIGEYVAKAEAGEITLSDHWAIGETKSVTLTTGEVIELQIADFNHDTFEDGVTAPVTFVMKDCLKTKAAIASTADDIADGGYPASDMKHFVETNIYDKLPSDLKKLVAPVKKKCYTTINESSLSEESYNVWLLSGIEVFGSNTDSVGTGEGTQYSVFTDSNTRVKSVNGTAAGWWLRSCQSSLQTYFNLVSSNGTEDYDQFDFPYGVVAGLCVRGTTESSDTNLIDVTLPEQIEFEAGSNGKFGVRLTFTNTGTNALELEVSADAYGDWTLVPKDSDFGSMSANQKKFSLYACDTETSSVVSDMYTNTYKFTTDASEATSFVMGGQTGLVTEDVVEERCVTIHFFIKEK